VRLHVGNGRDADARRLDDVDGVDADARADFARGGGVFPRHVGRDDGGNDDAMSDPNPMAVPSGRCQQRWETSGMADGAGGWGVLLRVDHVGDSYFSRGGRAG